MQRRSENAGASVLATAGAEAGLRRLASFVPTDEQGDVARLRDMLLLAAETAEHLRGENLRLCDQFATLLAARSSTHARAACVEQGLYQLTLVVGLGNSRVSTTVYRLQYG